MDNSKPSQRVRLADIAELVGVSKRVVGSVLNDYGKRSARVSEARRAEIKRVAAQLGYSRNLTAATLAGRGSRKVGALIDTLAPACFWRIALYFEEFASKEDYCLLLGQAHDSPEAICQRYENYMQHDVEACVCFAHDYPMLDKEGELKQFFLRQNNVLFIDAPLWQECWSVDIDREVGLRQALSHLQKIGRKKIAFWLYKDEGSQDRDTWTIMQRMNFFATSGLPEEQMFYRRDVGAFAEEIIRGKLDAVIAPSDVLAAKLASELLRRGCAIPADVAIVGHDSDPLAEIFYPSLTSISQRERLVGSKLWELVKRRLADKNGRAQKITVESTLEIRESTRGTM